MRGAYRMREWEVEHLTKIVKEAIEFCEKHPGETYDFTRMDICPYNIHQILTEQFGYEMHEVYAGCMDISKQYFHPSWETTEYLLHVCINVDTFDLFMIKE